MCLKLPVLLTQPPKCWDSGGSNIFVTVLKEGWHLNVHKDSLEPFWSISGCPWHQVTVPPQMPLSSCFVFLYPVKAMTMGGDSGPGVEPGPRGAS